MRKLMEHYCEETTESSFGIRHTASTLARNALFYVQSVGYYQVKPPYFTERENLPSFLMMYTLAGEGSLRTAAGTERMVPGSCAFVSCMEYHRYAPVGQQQWEFLWLHFNGSSSQGCHQEFAKNGKLVVMLREKERFSDHLREIIRLQRERGVSGELESNRLIVELITELFQSSGCRNRPEAGWPPYIRAVLRQIERTYGMPLTLDQLSGEVGISKYHLSREFKRWVGVSVMDYLLQVRLTRAKELLCFTDQPVKEVAQTCGFNDTSHFIQVFKTHENGETPLSYRRLWK